MDKNMHKYHQIKVAKVSKNKFSPNICIILNVFFGLGGFFARNSAGKAAAAIKMLKYSDV